MESGSLPSFAAVLLAGGRSQRMGRDKAGLLIGGEPLWQRQLAKLQALAPSELFISGAATGPYAGAGVEIVPDAALQAGPLAGIAATLRRAEAGLVLVLAVDLPMMTAEFLTRLVARARLARVGVVPRGEDWFEPLAAVYPRAALPLAEESLRGEDRSMQRFIARAIFAQLLLPFPLGAAEAVLFRNVNAPEDL